MIKYNFNDEKLINGFKQDLSVVVEQNNIFEAYKLFSHLKEIIEVPEIKDSLSESNFNTYQDIIIKAKFIALYKLEDNDVYELFSEYFNKIFEIDAYDPWFYIEHFIITNKLILEERDEFKEGFYKALSDSKTRITKNKILINNKQEEPNIANWLKDFRNEFTEKGFLDSMNLSKYFSNNKNFIKLDDNGRAKIQVLFNLYRRLKIPSSTLDGLEESISVLRENGERGVISKGNYERIPQDIINIYNKIQGLDKEEMSKEVSEKVFIPKDKEDTEIKKHEKKSIEKLLESYRNFEKNLKSIKSLSEQFKKHKNNIDKLSSEFETSLNKGNKDNAWAVILFVCENKLLNLFFKENSALTSEFRKYLSSRFNDDIIDNIIQKSDSPETVSLYLQFLLSNKLKFSIKASGLFGMHLANIFKKIGKEKYFPIVYGDLNLEQFIWRDVVEEAGVVKFK